MYRGEFQLLPSFAPHATTPLRQIKIQNTHIRRSFAPRIKLLRNNGYFAAFEEEFYSRSGDVSKTTTGRITGESGQKSEVGSNGELNPKSAEFRQRLQISPMRTTA